MRPIHTLLLVITLTLSACATLPAPSDTTGGMLAFPMQVSSESGGRFYYTYEFQVFRTGEEGVVDRIILDPTLNKRVATFGPYPVGEYYLGIQTTWPKQSQTLRFSYNPKPRRVFYAFTIEEDTITVLNNTMTVHKNRDRSTSSLVIPSTRETQADAVAQLRAEDGVGLWQLKTLYPIEE
ncbi:hypothetical protein ABMA57_15270 [Saccharospirillum sp. HFRX-1]|uniref:hypothetical protein n=1 Tax=unclassified Saccharospirillum TaxID=2633430 RepID=UPI003723573F